MSQVAPSGACATMVERAALRGRRACIGPERDAAAAAVGSRMMKGSQKPKKTGKKAPQKTMKEKKADKRAAAKMSRTMDV
ncbi:MAG: hypothetical protein LH654_00890 [Thermoleophilia bacterium]|nr:hypothetical protein [Thermoleophilia bacterium]